MLSAVALGTSCDCQQRGEDAAFEKSIEDRTADRLVEKTEIEQEGENRESRKGERELLPDVE